ncbi:AMP-binding protein [Sphingorhabdus sp.]|jgi:acyl-CoA synthetase (AMP-forming)/AMP-acid ligase II|uniref:class I adenylate-forming enzyme family protein n=1 Tax=Sphingorhabdus sp. TaxID=1902408 RepID=UPI0037C60189
MFIDSELEKSFGDFGALIGAWGEEKPDARALADSSSELTWREVAQATARIAAVLQRDGLQRGQAVAILGTSNIPYALVYLAVVRAGGCAAPLTTSATPAQLGAMFKDSGAMHLFVDAAKLADIEGVALGDVKIVMLENAVDDHPALADWMAEEGARFDATPPAATDPFNIIYSSGTTGTPKGIIHSHGMRWHQMAGGFKSIYNRDTRSLVSTPLYSNTTLAVFLPTICHGGFARIMEKFDALAYLDHAQTDQTTHTMLVPVQYARLLTHAEFDHYDLSSFIVKFCTSAPFAAELKADVLQRWPGGLVEIYGMTEGGVVCMLQAHHHPNKLHTVGQPVTGHELIVLDEDDNRLPAGSKGVLTGRSPTMMSGYKNQPEKTREMEWRDADGNIWLKTGDIGIVDADGFVSIVGRAKDMIISGGFNIYPKDLEELLEAQPEVTEAAVVGMPSETWGETPVGFVRLTDAAASPDSILARVNGQLGKTQRISVLYTIDEMPRSHIGKLLKTDLRVLAAEKQNGR